MKLLCLKSKVRYLGVIAQGIGCVLLCTQLAFALAPPSAFQKQGNDPGTTRTTLERPRVLPASKNLRDFLEHGWFRDREGKKEMMVHSEMPNCDGWQAMDQIYDWPLERVRDEISRVILEFRAKGHEDFLKIDPYSVVIARPSKKEISIYFYEKGFFPGITRCLRRYDLNPDRQTCCVEAVQGDEYVDRALEMRKDTIWRGLGFGFMIRHPYLQDPGSELARAIERAVDVPVRLERLQSQDIPTRAMAVLALSDTKGDGVLDALVRTMHSDHSENVRMLAASAVAMYLHTQPRGELPPFDILLAEFSRPDISKNMSLWVPQLIAWMGPHGKLALGTYLRRADDLRRRQVLQVLKSDRDLPGLLDFFAMYLPELPKPKSPPGESAPATQRQLDAIAVLGCLGGEKEASRLTLIAQYHRDLTCKILAMRAMAEIYRNRTQKTISYFHSLQANLEAQIAASELSVETRLTAIQAWYELLRVRYAAGEMNAMSRAGYMIAAAKFLGDKEERIVAKVQDLLQKAFGENLLSFLEFPLEDPNPRIRAGVVRFLGTLWYEPGVIQQIIRMFGDKHEMVKSAAEQTLKEIPFLYLGQELEWGDSGATVGLIAVNPGLPDKVRQWAVRCMGMSGDPETLKILQTLRRDPLLCRTANDALELWHLAADARNRSERRAAVLPCTTPRPLAIESAL